MQIQRDLRSMGQAFFAATLFCGLLAVTRPAAARPGAPADWSSSAGSQQPYHILDHWKLADSGWWDYLVVDSPAHRLYITRGDHVDVLDTQSGSSLNTIGHLHGTHGVALDTAGKFGYISDGGGNAVVAFDRNTLAIVATIPAGQPTPTASSLSRPRRRCGPSMAAARTRTVIDATTQKLSPPSPCRASLNSRPSTATAPSLTTSRTRAKSCASTPTPASSPPSWSAGCQSPSGLAFDIPGDRLFTVCDGKKMAAVDSESGKVLSTPPSAKGPDAAVWDAERQPGLSASAGRRSSLSMPASRTTPPSRSCRPSAARALWLRSATDRNPPRGPPDRPGAPLFPTNPHPRPADAPRLLHRHHRGPVENPWYLSRKRIRKMGPTIALRNWCGPEPRTRVALSPERKSTFTALKKSTCIPKVLESWRGRLARSTARFSTDCIDGPGAAWPMPFPRERTPTGTAPLEETASKRLHESGLKDDRSSPPCVPASGLSPHRAYAWENDADSPTTPLRR